MFLSPASAASRSLRPVLSSSVASERVSMSSATPMQSLTKIAPKAGQNLDLCLLQLLAYGSKRRQTSISRSPASITPSKTPIYRPDRASGRKCNPGSIHRPHPFEELFAHTAPQGPALTSTSCRLTSESNSESSIFHNTKVTPLFTQQTKHLCISSAMIFSGWHLAWHPLTAGRQESRCLLGEPHNQNMRYLEIIRPAGCMIGVHDLASKRSLRPLLPVAIPESVAHSKWPVAKKEWTVS